MPDASLQLRERFQSLLTEYYPRIYNYLLRMVRRAESAEDLTQEAFLKAWRSFARFDPQRPFAPWIFQIARRSALDAWRKRSPGPWPEGAGEPRTQDPSPEQRAQESESARRLEAALAQLPEEQRSAVFLYYIEHMSAAEVALALGKSAAGINSLLQRARRNLRQSLI